MTDEQDSKNLVSIRGTQCYMHKWDPSSSSSSSSSPKALVVIYHGVGAHGAYPTVRYAAEFLSGAGYAVVAFDFPGHGRSQGIQGYLKSSDDLVQDGVAMVQHAQSLYKDLPLILCGSSMGGAIAVLVANSLESTTVPKLILLAPMLKLNVSSLEHSALSVLNYVAPTARLIPRNATDASVQYRDPLKRKECEEDPLCGPSGVNMRIGTALACVETALNVEQAFEKIQNPYLLLIADEDVVVKNEGSEDFHKISASADKTKLNYPALHGLLCEPSPLFEEIKGDILEWLEKRV